MKGMQYNWGLDSKNKCQLHTTNTQKNQQMLKFLKHKEYKQ